MFKFIAGAVAVVVLVGYGVITTEHVSQAGDRAVNGINHLAKELDKATQ